MDSDPNNSQQLSDLDLDNLDIDIDNQSHQFNQFNQPNNTINPHPNTKTKPTKPTTSNNNNNNPVLPREFGKAKRTATRLVNQYFQDLKQQLLEHGGKFIYNRDAISDLQSAITKLATIQYTPFSSLTPKKPEIPQDFLLFYISQSQKLLKYNQNISSQNNEKPRQLTLNPPPSLSLPDTATPAAFGIYAYFFDGSKFHFGRMVYVPVGANFRVNLITGEVQLLENQPSIYRMKCSIVKVRNGFFICGGLVGEDKCITRRCSFFQVQTQTFHQLPSLTLAHPSPSGCTHNNTIYLLSPLGIEIYTQSNPTWSQIALPPRLHPLPFQYIVSTSQSEILLFGGRQNNKDNRNIQLYNTLTGVIDKYIDILPIGVTCQRAWGPMLVDGFVTVLSALQASNGQQVMVKRDAVQVVLVGRGGVFVNALVAV